MQLALLNMGPQEASTNQTQAVDHTGLFIKFEDGGKLYCWQSSNGSLNEKQPLLFLIQILQISK